MKKAFLILTVTTLILDTVKGQTVLYPPPVISMEYDFIKSCELKNHKTETVYTRFIYSGIDEYWSLKSDDKHCNEILAELYIPDDFELLEKHKGAFKNVHDNYWNKYLIIDAIGVYEDNNPKGYGHLGSYKARFTVKYIANIQVLNLVTKK